MRPVATRYCSSGGSARTLVLVEIAQVADVAAEPPRGALEHEAVSSCAVVGADEIAQRAGAVELAIGQLGIRIAIATECGAEMREVVERSSSSHGRKRSSSRTRAPVSADASPDDRPRVLRPHRDDARRRVPAPQPFVLDRAHTGSGNPRRERDAALASSAAALGRLADIHDRDDALIVLHARGGARRRGRPSRRRS